MKSTKNDLTTFFLVAAVVIVITSPQFNNQPE